MAQIVPYLIGGLTAFLAADVIPIPWAAPQPGALHAAVSAPAALLGTPASSFNRSAKGDRGAAARPAQATARIATIEVVGLRDAAIVYRDRDGRELFRTDPMSNVTIVTKGLQLPEVTVREDSGTVVRPVPVDDFLNEPAPAPKPPVSRGPKLPVGCESSFSPVAAPTLAHHIGRCMAKLEMPGIASALDG